MSDKFQFVGLPALEYCPAVNKEKGSGTLIPEPFWTGWQDSNYKYIQCKIYTAIIKE